MAGHAVIVWPTTAAGHMECVDSLIDGRMGCQDPRQPAIGRAALTVERAQRGRERDGEPPVGGELVGDEFGASTRGSIDQRTEHHQDGDARQHSGDEPVSPGNGLHHCHADAGTHDDSQ